MKKISTLVLLGLAFGSIQAAQISQSQALGVASKYVTVNGPQKLVRAVDKSYGGSDAPYYIFNSADGKGFVIVAGDDQLTELVGYSKTGSIDTSNMPVQLQAFLDGYADYVARVQSGEAAANHQTLTDGAAPVVEPLVKAHWDQSEPCRHHHQETFGCGMRGNSDGTGVRLLEMAVEATGIQHILPLHQRHTRAG